MKAELIPGFGSNSKRPYKQVSYQILLMLEDTYQLVKSQENVIPLDTKGGLSITQLKVHSGDS